MAQRELSLLSGSIRYVSEADVDLTKRTGTMQEPFTTGGATSNESFLFGPNKYYHSKLIDMRNHMLGCFGSGIVFVVVGLQYSEWGVLTTGILGIAMGAMMYKVFLQHPPMMMITAEGFDVDMRMPKGLCVCCTGMIPPSKFTWDQVESVRVVSFKDDVYEGSTEKYSSETRSDGTVVETTTTTKHYLRQEVSMLAVSFKSPKPDDLLLSTMARKRCGHAGPLRNLEGFDVDVVISGLAPLFAPDDDKHVYEYQARDTEYVLECFQKFLPDITLPPLYGVTRVEGGKVVMKWDLSIGVQPYSGASRIPKRGSMEILWKLSLGNGV